MPLTLKGYFDESERNEGSEPISVAGYIFKPTAYRRFCQKWKQMLVAGPTPTTYFHMTNLYARSYEYDGWTLAERTKVLKLAVAAIRENFYCGISVLFSQTEFERLAPPFWRFDYGSIYAGACQMVLRTTAFWMDERRVSLPVAYAFERGHRFWDEADAILKGIGQNESLNAKYRYGSHFSVDGEEAYGLQAADLLAWLMTRIKVGVPKNHSIRAFAPVLMSLAKGESHKYQLFHPDEAHLQRFFQEQHDRRSERFQVDFDKARKFRLR